MSAIAAILCRFVTQTTPTSKELAIVTAVDQWLPIQSKKRASLPEVEALSAQKTVFLAHLCKGGETSPTCCRQRAFYSYAQK